MRRVNAARSNPPAPRLSREQLARDRQVRKPRPTAARRDLEDWIDLELSFYAHGRIPDSDCVAMRRNLLQFAEAYAQRTLRAFVLTARKHGGRS